MHDSIPEAKTGIPDRVKSIPRMIPGANPVSCRTAARRAAAGELMKASLEGDQMRVRILLELGVSPNEQESILGTTALMVACLAGQTDIARDLLDHGARVDLRDNDGRTALMEACMAGDKDLVTMLVDRGADVNAQSRHGTTPLLAACISGKPDVIRTLLERGADVNAPNGIGTTPFLEAAASGCAESVSLLRRWGGDTRPAAIDSDIPLAV